MLSCLHGGLLGPIGEAECHVLLMVLVQLGDDEGVAHGLENVQHEERSHGHLVENGDLVLYLLLINLT